MNDNEFKSFLGRIFSSELSGTIIVDGKTYKLPPGYKCPDCYTSMADFKMHACPRSAAYLRRMRDEGKLEEVKP